MVGIDIDKEKIRDAENLSNPENLLFICADATKLYPSKIADVFIISNVLEYIEKRELFLSNLIEQTKAKKSFKSPAFERSWTMSLRKELGVNYFSDNDHKIEHKLCEFMTETNNAGIDISEYQTLWGEIWAVGQVQEEINCKKHQKLQLSFHVLTHINILISRSRVLKNKLPNPVK